MADSQLQSVPKQVNDVAEAKWQALIWPKLPQETNKEPLLWVSRVSDPFPSSWSQLPQEFIYYAYARGMRSSLRDGEVLGPVWGKIVVNLKTQSSPTFELITDKIEDLGTQGVGPVERMQEIHPLELMLRRTPENEKQLKTYYCRQQKWGNIPPLAVKSHPDFFKWLGCKGS